MALLDLLDRYLPTLEAELDGHLAAHRARQASEIGERALRLARDILDLDEFRDLALPGGLAKRGRPEPPPAPGATRASKKRKKPNDSPKAPGDRASDRGRRIRYEEVPFEEVSRAHSRFVAGTVQANTLHSDYQQAARSSESRLIYAALMIGKESIAFNDRTGTAGDYLEKLLDFYFKLNAKKPPRSKRRAQPGADQEPLDLGSPGRPHESAPPS